VNGEDAMVAFRSSDPRVGLTPDQISHLLERFYRVDKSCSRAFGGSGIGLKIAQSLTQTMGGAIWVEGAALGQGSSCTLILLHAHV
jgi:signal transduction histidine kinase